MLEEDLSLWRVDMFSVLRHHKVNINKRINKNWVFELYWLAWRYLCTFWVLFSDFLLLETELFYNPAPTKRVFFILICLMKFFSILKQICPSIFTSSNFSIETLNHFLVFDGSLSRLLLIFWLQTSFVFEQVEDLFYGVRRGEVSRNEIFSRLRELKEYWWLDSWVEYDGTDWLH